MRKIVDKKEYREKINEGKMNSKRKGKEQQKEEEAEGERMKTSRKGKESE